jgi:molybdate transport system substrate-binding protein
VLLFAAASTTNAVEAALEDFERTTGIATQVSFAASSALARQVLAGAGADLYLSANEEWADAVEEAGLARKRRILATNVLVCVTPDGAEAVPRAPQGLRAPAIERIAVGDPEGVPAGIYARRALEAAGLWQALEPRAIPCGDVRQALVLAERGEVDAALVYATDAAIGERVEVAFTFSPDATGPIRYPLLLIARDEPHPRAAALFEYLAGDAAWRHFAAQGFVRPGDTAP